MRNNAKGFTLIELIIVASIIGILASIAFPAYQTYATKTKIASITTTLSAGKTAIFQYYIDHGKMPETSAFNTDDSLRDFYELTGNMDETRAWGYGNATAGYMTYTLDNVYGDVNGKTLFFMYWDRNGSLEMDCIAPGIKNNFLPKYCHS